MRIGTLQFTQGCQKQNKGGIGAPGTVYDREMIKKLKWSMWTIQLFSRL